jgi:hypothetical protein
MRKNRQRVEKTKLCVSIPTELLDECDLYIENYSAYFTACLKNKLDSIRKRQMKNESSVSDDIIQISRTYNSFNRAESSTLPQKCNQLVENEDMEYEKLLSEFNSMRARKEY